MLLKKSFLHGDVLRRDIFTEVAPFADDIWFWAMAVLSGTKILIPSDANRGLIYIDIDRELSTETLGAENVNQGGNDVQLKRVIEKYPAVREKLIRESADFKPYLSVVMLLENLDRLDACFQNIFAQRFPDFELKS